MVEADVNFIKKVLSLNVLRSPCLEIGGGLEDQNARRLILQNKLEYFSADIVSSPLQLTLKIQRW